MADHPRGALFVRRKSNGDLFYSVPQSANKNIKKEWTISTKPQTSPRYSTPSSAVASSRRSSAVAGNDQVQVWGGWRLAKWKQVKLHSVYASRLNDYLPHSNNVMHDTQRKLPSAGGKAKHKTRGGSSSVGVGVNLLEIGTPSGAPWCSVMLHGSKPSSSRYGDVNRSYHNNLYAKLRRLRQMDLTNLMYQDGVGAVVTAPQLQEAYYVKKQIKAQQLLSELQMEMSPRSIAGSLDDPEAIQSLMKSRGRMVMPVAAMSKHGHLVEHTTARRCYARVDKMRKDRGSRQEALKQILSFEDDINVNNEELMCALNRIKFGYSVVEEDQDEEEHRRSLNAINNRSTSPTSWCRQYGSSLGSEVKPSVLIDKLAAQRRARRVADNQRRAPTFDDLVRAQVAANTPNQTNSSVYQDSPINEDQIHAHAQAHMDELSMPSIHSSVGIMNRLRLAKHEYIADVIPSEVESEFTLNLSPPGMASDVAFGRRVSFSKVH